jgi:hypothetical protein
VFIPSLLITSSNDLFLFPGPIEYPFNLRSLNGI